MNRPLVFIFLIFVASLCPRASAAQTDCANVESKYRVVIHRLPDGQFALFQKFFFQHHHQPKDRAVLWELESPDPADRAVIDFGSSSPFSAAHFECRPGQPACSGLATAMPGATEFSYTITVQPRNGPPQTVDPGMIIDGPAVIVSPWRIFVY